MYISLNEFRVFMRSLCLLPSIFCKAIFNVAKYRKNFCKKFLHAVLEIQTGTVAQTPVTNILLFCSKNYTLGSFCTKGTERF